MSQLDPNSTTATLLPIYAPFDGVVIGRDLAKGEVVSPGQHHFEIADVSKMWIVLNVREQDADDLELGQKVDFATGNVTVTGTISWMSTAVDEKSRTVEVRCEIDNPEIVHADGTSDRQATVAGQPVRRRHDPRSRKSPGPDRADQGGAAAWSVALGVRRDRSTNVRSRAGCAGHRDSPTSPRSWPAWTNSEPVVIEGSHILKAELQRLSQLRQRPT